LTDSRHGSFLSSIGRGPKAEGCSFGLIGAVLYEGMKNFTMNTIIINKISKISFHIAQPKLK